jgi:cystathionine beta-lyase/cystathionine gamma-synthase
LEGQAGVEAVLYPGLSSHPDHATATRTLQGGFGGVLSFELKGGRAAVERFVDELQLIKLVSSLGGVATTVNHPASTSHRNLDDAQKRQGGIHDGLMRLAVGIEAVDDVIGDLQHALAAAGRIARPVVAR